MSDFVVLGSNGILGSNVFSSLIKKGHNVVGVNRHSLDVMNLTDLSSFLNIHARSTILNCIGFMPADKCEAEPARSKEVNLIFPRNLSTAIEKNKQQKLIHFSSDFVFDGEKGAPYVETDTPNPLSIYGEHKLESEISVRSVLADRVKVIRFSSLICMSQSRKNFLEKIVDKARTGEDVTVVDDLRISMATTELISTAIEKVFTYEKELFHVVHPGETSWFLIALQALETLNIEATVKPVSASLFQSAAPRPKYSVMHPSDEILKLNRLSWDEALVKFIQENSSLI